MQIHLYQESPQDWEAFLHLCGLYYPEEAKFPLTQSGLLELCQESVKEHRQGSGRILLLFSSEKPIGFAFFQRPGNPIPLKKQWPEWGYVRDFYIHPKARKNGYGRALYAALRKDLEESEALGVLLIAEAKSSGLFWEKIGLKKTFQLHSFPLHWVYQESLKP